MKLLSIFTKKWRVDLNFKMGLDFIFDNTVMACCDWSLTNETYRTQVCFHGSFKCFTYYLIPWLVRLSPTEGEIQVALLALRVWWFVCTMVVIEVKDKLEDEDSVLLQAPFGGWVSTNLVEASSESFEQVELSFKLFRNRYSLSCFVRTIELNNTFMRIYDKVWVKRLGEVKRGWSGFSVINTEPGQAL